jgi:hypothetical protein
MTLSDHFMIERMERMVYIGMNIGYGEIVFTYLDKRNNRRYCLTTTGLLEVLAPDEDVLITAFPCDINRAYALTRLAGMDHIPHEAFQAIKNNGPHIRAICTFEGKNWRDYLK